MSFSKNAKNEVMDREFANDDCRLSFLSGLIMSIGKIDEKTNELKIYTEIEKLITVLEEIIKKIYSETLTVKIINNYGINKIDYFKISFSKDLTRKVLLDTDCSNLEQEKIEIRKTISQKLTKTEDLIKWYVSGVFVGIGTSSIKFSDEHRKTTGYHLEFASKNHDFLLDLASLMAQFDIFAKLIKRKNMFVLYVKDAGEVSNVLALVGAYNAVLQLQNEMATREVRNKVNRQTNCMSANINKTVEASFKQVSAIEVIINKIGLENLPQDLQTVALLRLANTEESLDELLKLSKLPLTKSALNYRFKKLLKIAEELK